MALGALLLSSCGDKALTLPEDPLDRAATCSVVAAVQARAGTKDANQPLPFEAQGRILHYAMLAGAQGDSFDRDKAAAVNKRMSANQDRIIDGNWESLVAPCQQAFPETAVETVTLPEGRTALLGCDELGEFIRGAMARQGAEYDKQLGEYFKLGQSLDKQAGDSSEADKAERRKAMAQIVHAGSPMDVMQQCEKRFG
jgi:hypothetical protein